MPLMASKPPLIQSIKSEQKKNSEATRVGQKPEVSEEIIADEESDMASARRGSILSPHQSTLPFIGQRS